MHCYKLFYHFLFFFSLENCIFSLSPVLSNVVVLCLFFFNFIYLLSVYVQYNMHIDVRRQIKRLASLLSLLYKCWGQFSSSGLAASNFIHWASMSPALTLCFDRVWGPRVHVFVRIYPTMSLKFCSGFWGRLNANAIFYEVPEQASWGNSSPWPGLQS